MSKESDAPTVKEFCLGPEKGISEDEEKALIEFRKRIEGENLFVDEQFILLRFLRARKLDLDKSVEMYRAALEWRGLYTYIN